MPRLGREYEELVASVVNALDPKTEIRVGEWVAGPDGQREIDVEVRGTIDGDDHFILIECKDWGNPVGIGEVDKLDSKRKDLNADTAIIYSNSGFTEPAIRKANRVGIEAASALASGDKRIKIKVYREYYAKLLSIDKLQVTVFPSEESNKKIPDNWDYNQLYLDDYPVVNWMHELSLKLLNEYEDKHQIVATFAFKTETIFQLQGLTVSLRGIRLTITCSQKWLSQTVQEDVSLGLYDHISRRVTVPSKHVWSLGPFDREGWIEITEAPEGLKGDLEPNTFRLNLTLLNPIPKIEDAPTPDVDNLVSESGIEAW